MHLRTYLDASICVIIWHGWQMSFTAVQCGKRAINNVGYLSYGPCCVRMIFILCTLYSLNHLYTTYIRAYTETDQKHFFIFLMTKNSDNSTWPLVARRRHIFVCIYNNIICITNTRIPKYIHI